MEWQPSWVGCRRLSDIYHNVSFLLMLAYSESGYRENKMKEEIKKKNCWRSTVVEEKYVAPRKQCWRVHLFCTKIGSGKKWFFPFLYWLDCSPSLFNTFHNFNIYSFEIKLWNNLNNFFFLIIYMNDLYKYIGVNVNSIRLESNT